MARRGTNGGTRQTGKEADGGATVTSGRGGKVRYAVVGLGHIAQVAVLPAFAHAKGNSVLAALVSDDPVKLRALGKKYKVERRVDYAGYEGLMRSGEVDAVYIALPNTMHRRYTEIAARAGVHVLCEKPLAASARDCAAMVRACDEAGVLLMTAYRLHFEGANLKAAEVARSGELGEIVAFNSVFTMQVKDAKNIRLKDSMGGGPLHDIGIYCINAARSVMGDEPVEVYAWAESMDDPRFKEVPQTVAFMLRYPGHRLGTIVCSFGAAETGAYQVIGTKGDVRLDPAYGYSKPLTYTVTVKKRSRTRTVARKDQFAAELLYFSRCVKEGRRPEPSGREGWEDVRIIEALQKSIRLGRSVKLERMETGDRDPSIAQRMAKPPVKKVKVVRAQSPKEA